VRVGDYNKYNYVRESNFIYILMAIVLAVVVAFFLQFLFKMLVLLVGLIIEHYVMVLFGVAIIFLLIKWLKKKK